MEKNEKEALQVSKEIIIKFIEAGKVSPTNIGEIFPSVYLMIKQTIGDSAVKEKFDGKR